MKGFALYKRDGDLYILGVAYEYPDSQFVGFDPNGEVFKIHKLNDTQREWLKTHDPAQNKKTSNLTFLKDYYLSKVTLGESFPTGKPYTQLPGGGGVYKETRKYHFINDLFDNETILRAIEKYGMFNEGYNILKSIIKEAVNNVVLNQESPRPAFTAVSIEDESEKDKISKVFDFLKEQGKIPEDFIRPMFKDGTLDYHMTIMLGELPMARKRDLDKEVSLNIETIGVSKQAVALGVSGDYFSERENQHITLAFKSLPRYSNEIENWVPLKTPIKVVGIIREFTQDKEIIKRGVFDNPIGEANQIQVGNFPDQSPAAGRASSFPQEEK